MGINTEKLKENFERKSAARADRLNLENGDNTLRLLPPSMEYFEEEIEYIAIEYLMHFNIEVDGEKKAEVCPKSWGKKHKCPICEAVKKLYASGTQEDKTLAGNIRAKKRFLFNVLDKNNLDKGIQVMETGPKLYEDIIRYVTSEKYQDILDIDTGRDIVITKTPAKESSTGYVSYDLMPEPDRESIRQILPEGWKDALNLLLTQKPVAKSYDILKAILLGEDIPEEEEETTPVKESVEKETSKEEVSGEEDVVKKEETPKEEEEKPTKKSKVSDDAEEKPSCYGVDYGPKREQCKECPVKVACRKVFLEI